MTLKIGRINTPTLAGQKVTVYFGNTSQEFVAAHDLTSSQVAVIGDRVFNADNSLIKSQATTRLFKSNNDYTEDNNFPWAYLFEINEFNDLSVPYTDPSWNWDDLKAYWKPFGDGGGDFETQQELIASFDRTLDGSAPYYRIKNGSNGFTITGGISDRERPRAQLYIGSPSETSEHFRLGANTYTDGVQIAPYSILFDKESRSDSRYIGRVIQPERSYWVKERFEENWSYIWSNEDEILQGSGRNTIYPSSGIYRAVSVGGNSQGETGRSYNAILRTYVSPGRTSSRQMYRYSISADGEVSESFEDSLFIGGLDREPLRASRDAALAAFNATGYTAPTFNRIDLQYDRKIFTGQQLLNGDVGRTYPHPGGSIPGSFTVEGEQWLRRSPGGIVEGRGAFPEGFIYTFNLYIIPEVGDRNPGKKEIYTQVRQNKKVLLHSIPINETWDGALSPVDKEIEVVIRCGKKRKEDGTLTNYQLSREAQNNPNRLTKFDRDWSQTRVYRLSQSGEILSTKVFNNSATTLNPSSTPSPIIIDDRNWQKPWLSSHADYRTLPYRLFDFPRDTHLWHLRERTGQTTDLTSWYRTQYSDRNTAYFKTITDTRIVRQLIDFTGYGTLTNSGFVYIEPEDLYDPEVQSQIDYSLSFGTRVKPDPNRAVVMGLANGTTKNSYYLVNATFGGNIATNIIALQKSTQFPKLDLPEELGDLQVGIKAIAFLGN